MTSNNFMIIIEDNYRTWTYGNIVTLPHLLKKKINIHTFHT